MKTLTIKQMETAHPLAPAVIRQLGYRSAADELAPTLQDVANHGADSGWPGFIYYNETRTFTRKNRRTIAEAIESLADDWGESPLALVRGFGCLKSDTYYTDREIARALWGGNAKVDPDALAVLENALAWFALEEVANAVQNATEQ